MAKGIRRRGCASSGNGTGLRTSKHASCSSRRWSLIEQLEARTLFSGTAPLTELTTPLLASASTTQTLAVPQLELSAYFSPTPARLSNGTYVTNDRYVKVKGATARGARVTFDVDGDGFDDGRTVASKQGTFALMVRLTDGTNTVRVRAVNGAGAEGLVSLVIVRDTTKPAVPAAPDLATDSDSGVSSVDNLTNIRTAMFNGTAEANAVVQLLRSGKVIGATTAGIDGVWTLTLGADQQLPTGASNIAVRAVDAAGNTSDRSPYLKVTVDMQPPARPTLVLDPAFDTSPKGDHQTTLAVVALRGSTSANTSVRLLKGALEAATAVSNGSGAFQFTGVNLGAGANAFTVVANDAAGNSSSFDRTITRTGVSNETTPPSLTAALANDTGSLPADGVTSDPAIAGSLSDASGIASFVGGFGATPSVNLLGDLQANGTFSLSRARLDAINGSALADGPHTLRLQASDTWGNTTTVYVDVAFTLDTLDPATPTFVLDAASDTSPLGDGQTSLSSVKLTGATSALARVTLERGAVSLTETTADASGNFTFDGVALDLGDNAFTTRAYDLAGNTSSANLTVTRIAGVASDVVLDWNARLLNVIALGSLYPPAATRAMAMMSAAVYDAINAITPLGATLYVQAVAPDGASEVAAAAAAAHRVLATLFPAQKASFDAQLALSLAAVPDGQGKTDGIAVGQSVADTLLELRKSDGSNAFVQYDAAPGIGVWQATGPAFEPALAPQWGDVTPFALSSGDQFRAPAPPAMDSQEYADAVNEIKSLGVATGSSRTSEQTVMARFWADGLGTFTPAGHWNTIAAQVAVAKGATLADNARMFALLNIAMADAGIATWDTKYAYNYWRPVTAIQKADLDGNDQTSPDAAWQSLIVTPNFPDYVSGHSAFSTAGEVVLSRLFGNDTPFTIASPSLANVTRTFNSFSEAADEAGVSRVYGGIHFRFATVAGADLGRAVGQAVLDRFDTTVDLVPPTITITGPATGLATRDPVTVTGQVIDSLSAVTSFTASVDEGDPFEVTVDATGKFTLPVPLALDGSADGSHTVVLVAVDSQGNTSYPMAVSFVIDTTVPAITLTTPVAGPIAAGERLAGTADGTGSPIVSLAYAFDGGEATPLAYDVATGSFDEELDLSKLAAGSHQLKVTATDRAGNSITQTVEVSLAAPVPLALADYTPTAGSSDIGATYRPKITFTRAVNKATLTSESLYATVNGQKIAATIVPSDDGTFAWLFPTNPMPGATTVKVTVNGDLIQAADGSLLDADGDGTAGGVLTFSFSTVPLAIVPGTALSGVVADPGPDLKPGTVDDVRAGADGVLMTPDDVYLNPIAGATVYIIGLEQYKVVTGADGRFSFDKVPSGGIKLVVDGRTATNAPAGVFWPEMVMDLRTNPGVTNTVMAGMLATKGHDEQRGILGTYLPRIQSSILKDIDPSQATTIGVDASSAPDLTEEQRNALRLEVQPGSLVDENGQKITNGQVGISTVPPELVREMLPVGLLEHTFDITIQAPGVVAFSTPLQITFPNTFNAAPGTKLNFLSFDHTTGRLVIEGTATVSEDGLTVTTDPGTGITKPGWHGLTPPGSLTRSGAGSTIKDVEIVDEDNERATVIITGSAGDIITVDLSTAGGVNNPFSELTIASLAVSNIGDVVPLENWQTTLRNEDRFYFRLKDPTLGRPGANGAVGTPLATQFLTLTGKVTRDGKTRSVRLNVQIKIGRGHSTQGPNAVTAGKDELSLFRQQQRLAYFGFPGPSSRPLPVDGKLSPQFTHAVSLFNAVTSNRRTFINNGTLLSPSDVPSLAWLNAAPAVAPFWRQNGTRGAGWRNVEASAKRHDWGTSWAFDVIAAAARKASAANVVLQVDDLSEEYGGDTGHSGHQTGIDIDIDTVATNTVQVPFYKVHSVTVGTVTTRYIATKDAETSKVVSIRLLAGGSGYTEPPTITISGGEGSGAVATATVVGGRITAIQILNGGSGYKTAPTITIEGDGAGASAQATLDKRQVIKNGGTGAYYAAPITDTLADALQHVEANYDSEAVLRGIRDLIVDNDEAKYVLADVVAQLKAFTSLTATDVASGARVEKIFYNDPRTWSDNTDEQGNHVYGLPTTAGFISHEADHGGHFHVNILGPSSPSGAALASLLTTETEAAVLASVVSASTGFGSDSRLYYRFDLPEGGTVSGRTDSAGNFEAFLAPSTAYVATFYQASTNRWAEYGILTNESGQPSEIGQIYLDQFGGVDSDGDGIPDMGERAIGTALMSPDTDGDGISDAAEITQGLDPLGGRVFTTGVAAAVSLLGEAKGIAVAGSPTNREDQTAYVATGSHGLAIVAASPFTNPIVLGQLDLDGDATDVAVDPSLGIAVVAANGGGLHFLSVSDASDPRLIQTIATTASQVEIVNGVAYVASGANLIAYDVATGEELQTLALGGGTIRSISVAGSMLYSLDQSSLLRVIDISGLAMFGRGSVTLPFSSGKLFAGDGVAYVGATNGFTGGFMTVDVANPDAPALISGADNTSMAGTAIAANGSGLGVVIGNPGGATNALDVVSLGDPANTGSLITRITLTANPFAVAIAGGIAFVADGTGGLQVVNYTPFDNKGVAPTVDITTNAPDIDPVTPGRQIIEGSPVNIRATISDDVQVRNVELLLNGQVVRNDVSYPFDISFIAPSIVDGNTTLTVQVRATDTGGNVTVSEAMTFELVEDTFPPTVVATSPAAGAEAALVRSIRLRFNEAIDPTRLSLAGMLLVGAGTDGSFGTGDDVVQTIQNFSTRDLDHTLVIVPEGELAPGSYRLTLDPTIIVDVAGNAIAAPVTLDFSKRSLTSNLAFGQIVSASLTEVGEENEYTFTGAVGQQIYYDGLDWDFDAITFRIVDPSGATILSNVNTDSNYGPLTVSAAGTYKLIISSTLLSDYSFRVLDVGSQLLVPRDTATASTLPTAQTAIYRLQATAGERLHLDSQSAAATGVTWRLVDAYGSSIASGTIDADLFASITNTGEYVLLIENTSPTPADYAFQVGLPPVTPVAIGDVLTRTLAASGDQDDYSFAGTAGQQLFLDALEFDGDYVYASLIDPSGNTVSTSLYANGDSAPFTLKTTGTYRLYFFSYYSYIGGDYNVRLTDVSSAGPIILGQTVSSTINPEAETEIYRVDALAGQLISFNSLSPAATAGSWSMYASDSTYAASGSLGSSSSFRAPREGSYVLLVRRNAAGAALDYSFNLTAGAATAITIGDTVNTTLAPSGAGEFTFAGTKGQKLYYDGISFSANAYLTIYSPSGVRLVDNYYYGYGDQSLALDIDGTYRIVLRNQSTNPNDVSFRLLDYAAAAPVTIGQTYNGSIEYQTTQLLRFDGTAGQRLMLDGLDQGSTNVTVFTPFGNSLASVWSGGDSYPFALPATGTYYLVVNGYGGNGTPYAFRVLDVATADALPLDTDASGTLTPGNSLKLYRVELAVGNRLYFDGRSNNSNGYFTLYDPLNQSVAGQYISSDFEYTATRAGTYLLVASGSDANNPVDYEFHVTTPVETSGTYSIGSLASGTISEAGEIDRLTFTGSAGQRLVFDGLGTDFSLYVRINSPDGSSIASFYADQDYGPFTLGVDGTYQIVIDPDGTTTGNYAFRLLDTAAAETLPLDTVVSGTMAPGNTAKLYKLSLTAGQRLYIDGQSDNTQGYWTLYGPDDSSRGGTYVAYDFEHAVGVSGEYLLVINSTNTTYTDPIPYVLQIITSPETTSNLVLGTEVNGTIAEPGEWHSYTFTGTVGQRLVFDALGTTPSLAVRLEGPGGTIANFDADNDSGVITLGLPGTYQLIVDPSGAYTGDYRFRLLDVASAVAMPLDTVVSGTLNPGNSTALYTVTLSAGQRIYLDGQGPGGVATLSVTGANEQWGPGAWTDSDFEYTASATGDYLVMVNGRRENTDPADYQFQIATPTETTTGITLGSVVSGSIVEPGDVRRYTFSGVAGQRLFFDALGIEPSLGVGLYAPGGANIAGFYADNDAGSWTLAETGTYTLVIDPYGSTTGDFSFQILDLATATTVALDTPISGTLAPGAQTILYKVALGAGQRLYFDGQSDNGNAFWSIVAPGADSGTVSNSINGDFEYTAPVAGTYVVAIQGYNGQVNPIDYLLQIVTPTETTSVMTLGNVVSGSIAEFGDVRRYTFSGVAGQRLYFDALGTAPNLRALLYSPSGSSIGNFYADNDFGTVTLTQTGTYSLVIDPDGGSTGDYSFRLVDVSTSPTLALDTPVSGTLTPGNSTMLFKVTLAAGQRLAFDGQSDNGNANWYVNTPNDQWAAGSSINSDFEYTAPVAGTYVVAVQGYNAHTEPVEYLLQVNNAGTDPVTPDVSTPLVLGSLVTGTISTAGETDAYGFTGGAGQLLSFDGVSGSGIELRLYDAFGTLIQYWGGTSDVGSFVLPRAGQYRLDVYGYGGTTGDYSFRLSNLSSATPLTLDTDISVSLPAQSATLYRFTGTSGQRLYVDVTSGANGSFWLYGPQGQSIMSASAGSDFQVTLPSDGSFTLLLQNYVDSPQDYSFRVITPTTSTAALNIGSLMSGTISEAGEVDEYTFTGTPGQRLFFDGSGQTSFDVHLYDPNGNEIRYYGSAANAGPVTLTRPGTYRVAVWGNNGQTGDYSFRFLDTAAATAIALDATVTDALTAQGMRLYSFTATAGQRLYLDGLGSDGNGDWYLYGSTDGSLAGTAINGDMEVTIPRTGTYFLQVGSYDWSTSPLDYSFRIVTPATIATAYTVGDTIAASIVEPAELHEYTFNAVAGQRLFFDAIGTEGFDVRLHDPFGANIANWQSNNDAGAFTLLHPGTYRITVRGNGGQTGSYSFRLLDAAAATPLSLDTVVNSTLAKGTMRLYQFTGTAGQRLFVDALGTDGNGYWYLYDTVRNVTLGGAGISGNFEATLPADGTYILQINSYEWSAEDLALNFKIVTPVTTNAPLTLNTTVNGSINEPGTIHEYEFTGTAGQVLAFDGASLGARISGILYDPFGNYVGGWSPLDYNNEYLFTLKRSGTYRLVVRGDDDVTGPYSVTISDVAAGTTLALDTVTTGALAPHQDRLFKFTATAGRLFINSTTPDSHYFTVYDTFGRVVANQYGWSDGDVSIAQDGTYYLRVANNGSLATNFSFALTTPSTSSTPLVLGQLVNASIGEAGEADEFTFTAVAGQRFSFDGISGNSFYYQLLDPSGVTVRNWYAGGDDASFSLLTGGNYRLVVRADSDVTGVYGFRLTDVVSASSLAPDTQFSGTLAVREAQVYSFTATAGQVLRLDALNYTSSIGWDLYGPGDQYVYQQTYLDDRTIVLSSAGTYVFRVFNRNTLYPSAFSFNASY